MPSIITSVHLGATSPILTVSHHEQNTCPTLAAVQGAV